MSTNRIPNDQYKTHKEFYQLQPYLVTLLGKEPDENTSVDNLVTIDLISEMVDYLRTLDDCDRNFFYDATSEKYVGGRVYRNVDLGKGSSRKNFVHEEDKIRYLILAQKDLIAKFKDDLSEIDKNNPFTIETIKILFKVRRKLFNTLLQHPKFKEFDKEIRARFKNSPERSKLKNNFRIFINPGFLFIDQFTNIVSKEVGAEVEAKNAAIALFVSKAYNSTLDPDKTLKELTTKMKDFADPKHFAQEFQTLIESIKADKEDCATVAAENIVNLAKRLRENTSRAHALRLFGEEPINAVHKTLLEKFKELAKCQWNNSYAKATGILVAGICTYINVNYKSDVSQELFELNSCVRLAVLVNACVGILGNKKLFNNATFAKVSQSIIENLMYTSTMDTYNLLRNLLDEHPKTRRLVAELIYDHLNKLPTKEVKLLDPFRLDLYIKYLEYAHNDHKFDLEDFIKKFTKEPSIPKQRPTGEVSTSVQPSKDKGKKRRPQSTAYTKAQIEQSHKAEGQANRLFRMTSIKNMEMTVQSGVTSALQLKIPRSTTPTGRRTSNPGEEVKKTSSNEKKSNDGNNSPQGRKANGSPKMPSSTSTGAVIQSMPIKRTFANPAQLETTPPGENVVALEPILSPAVPKLPIPSSTGAVTPPSSPSTPTKESKSILRWFGKANRNIKNDPGLRDSSSDTSRSASRSDSQKKLVGK